MYSSCSRRATYFETNLLFVHDSGSRTGVSVELCGLELPDVTAHRLQEVTVVRHHLCHWITRHRTHRAQRVKNSVTTCEEIRHCSAQPQRNAVGRHLRSYQTWHTCAAQLGRSRSHLFERLAYDVGEVLLLEEGLEPLDRRHV
jgi:hypothetical protein